MVYLAFLPLLLAVALCLGLSRVVATRTLGLLAAAAPALAALVLLIGEWQPGLLADIADVWLIAPYGVVLHAPFAIAPSLTLALELTLLLGGAVTLAMLAVALSPTVRGFGTLFGWSLLAIAATLLGLSSHGLLLPISWTLVVLTAYGTVWSSGALDQYEGIPGGLVLGLLSSLLLIVGLLIAESALVSGQQPAAPALLCLLLACLILCGSAPFHSAFDEVVEAPAALGGLLYGLVLPVLALGTLLRLVTGNVQMLIEAPGIVGTPYTLVALPSLAEMPLVWRTFLVIAGVLSLLTCVAGAIRQHDLRRLLAWQTSWQASLVIIAAGLPGLLATLAAPTLLLNLALTTLLGTIAVALMERLLGSSDFTQVVGRDGSPLPWTNLWLPGMLWAIAALSALGLPPMLGFWGRFWLLEAMLTQTPWIVPLVLTMSVLAGLAYLVPMARFWFLHHSQPTRAATRARPRHSPLAVVCAWLAVVPLLVLGVVPQWMWQGAWVARLPISPEAQAGVVIAAVVMLLVLALLTRCQWSRPPRTDIDMIPVVLAPDALAQRLGALAWPGRPGSLFGALWAGLVLLSRGIRGLLWLFEQRFYLAGVLLALIVLVFLMAQ